MHTATTQPQSFLPMYAQCTLHSVYTWTTLIPVHAALRYRFTASSASVRFSEAKRSHSETVQVVSGEKHPMWHGVGRLVRA